MKVKNTILKLYFSYFNFIAKDRIKNNDTPLLSIHALIAVTIGTSFLMWAYTFVAYKYSYSMRPYYIGLVASIIHLFSPLLYRVSKNTLFISSVMLAAGMIHQSSFALYSGGFNSNCLIWLGIIPMLAGIIEGKRGVLLWGLLAIITSAGFLALDLYDVPIPDYLAHEGHIFSQALLCFGYILLSTTLIYVYLAIEEDNKRKSHIKSSKIKNLLRIVMHDISNPLTVLNAQLKKINHTVNKIDESELTTTLLKTIDNSKFATSTIKEIIENVRDMHALEDGKQVIKFNLYSLNDCIKHSLFIFSSQIESKKISINYDFESHKDLKIYVDDVTFKNQVLSNIISNAIKFSDENGSIDINVKRQEDKILLSIKDHGIGMPQSLLSNIFIEGKATSRKGTKGEKGTGYGMIIIKAFVEAFGGTIQVSSSEREQGHNDSGTKITMNLLSQIPSK